MPEHYNFRVMSPAGHVEQRGTIYKLTRTINALNRATGQQWPCQVIYRALKRCSA